MARTLFRRPFQTQVPTFDLGEIEVPRGLADDDPDAIQAAANAYVQAEARAPVAVPDALGLPDDEPDAPAVRVNLPFQRGNLPSTTRQFRPDDDVDLPALQIPRPAPVREPLTHPPARSVPAAGSTTAPVGLADDDEPAAVAAAAPDDDSVGLPNEADSLSGSSFGARRNYAGDDADFFGADPMRTAPREKAASRYIAPAARITPQEQAAIDAGRGTDQRLGRAQRILAGIGGGLGLLGAITGSDAALSIGTGAVGAGSNIQRDNEARARAEAEARRATEQTGIDAQNEAIRAEARDAMAQRAADSNVALDQARMAAIQDESQRDRDAAAMDAVNAAALRREIRAEAESLPNGAPYRRELLELLDDPEFQAGGYDAIETAYQGIRGRMGMRATYGQGGGGVSGPRQGFDAVTGATTVTGGGRRRDDAAPGVASAPAPVSDGFDDITVPAPGQAPAPRPLARGARRAATGPTPQAPVPAAPFTIPGQPSTPTAPASGATNPEANPYIPLVMAAVPDVTADELDHALTFIRSHPSVTAEVLATPRGHTMIRRVIAQARSATPGGRSDIAGRDAETLARAESSEGMPPHLDRTWYNQQLRFVREPAQRVIHMRGLVSLLRNSSDAQLRAALHGGQLLSDVAGASDLRSQIYERLNQYFSDLGGAVINPSEERRFMSAFGAGSSLGDVETFRNAIYRMRQRDLQTIGNVFNAAPDGHGQEYGDFYNRHAMGAGR